jgi:predicted CopG family antitoxin
MKRKQLSVYLSDDIYQYLVAYKDGHGLNNISMVIERIVLERIFRENGSLDMPIKSSENQREARVETKASKLLKNIKEGMPN